MASPAVADAMQSFGAILAFLRRPPLGVTLTICGLLLAARRPDLVRNPQFWAEDGSVFFLQALTLGPVAFLQPSAGYFHTALRGVAWLAAKMDVSLSPAIFVTAAAALTLYVAARTQSARFPLPPSIGYALAVVLVPDAWEVLLNLTNLQWILAAGLLLVLISAEPISVAQKTHDVAAAIVLGLTGPFSIALLPFFAGRAFQRRTRFSISLACIIAACAAVQAVAIHTGNMQMTPHPVAAENLLAIPGTRIGSSLLTGGRLSVDSGLLVASLAGLITLALIIWLALRRDQARVERIWLGGAFIALLAVSFYRCKYVLFDLCHAGCGARYFYPLQLVALWLVIAACSLKSQVGRAALACLMVCALANVGRFRETAFTDYDWPAYAAAIRRGEAVTVPINPERWQFHVPSNVVSSPGLPRTSNPRTTIVNVSTRCKLEPNQSATVAFVLHDGAPRKILLRAVGPSLANFGVPNAVAEPEVRLLRDQREVGNLENVRRTPDAAVTAAAAISCGAFPLDGRTDDVAAVIELEPGAYTAVVSSRGQVGGEVLVEIYELPPSDTS